MSQFAPIALVVALVAASLLVGAALAGRSLTSFLLVAYVALAAQVVALVTVLSPSRDVTQRGLAIGETALLAGAAALWWACGRPGVSLTAAAAAAREIGRDRVVAAFAVVVGVGLAYELLLVATVPPNNWDSLTYHLARVAEWVQHGGVHWIPNAPTDRMNEFQSIAEQGILFLFAATGGTRLFALPQYLAQLAVLVAIYAMARRLGHARAASAGAALMFAGFTLVALEATTAQNDLVAASFPAAAAALLLSGAAPAVAVAGVAVGLGLGVKLTTLLVAPILIALAVRLGRRRALLFGGSAAASFAALGMWSFVLNRRNTGEWLGNGGGRVELDAPASPVGFGLTGFRTLYRLLDLSGFDRWALAITILGSAIVAALAVVLSRDNGEPGLKGLGKRILPALPLLAPLLVLELATVAKAANEVLGIDMNDPRFTGTDFGFKTLSGVNEDMSAFGALGGLALLGAVVVSLVLVVRRRSLGQALVLGLSLPVFVGTLALLTKYNAWLPRFLIVPVALTTPLLAVLFRRRDVAITVVGVSSLTLGLALVFSLMKPLYSAVGHPWQWSRADAISVTWKPEMGSALALLDERVPTNACLGASLGGDEPSYLLYGPRLERRVVYLAPTLRGESARLAELHFVVVGGAGTEDAIFRLLDARWRVRWLGDSWSLAENPRITGKGCPAVRG